MPVSELQEKHKIAPKRSALCQWEPQLEWFRVGSEIAPLLSELECPFGRWGQVSPQEEWLKAATVASAKKIFDQLAQHIALTGYRSETEHSFAEDVRYFKENLQELLSKYRGKYVAIVNRRVVDADKDFSALARRVFDRYGCRDILMPKVTEKEEVVHIPTPFAEQSSRGQI